MRKKLFYLLTFLLATAIGFDVGWAATATYSLTPNQQSTGSSATKYITTLTEFTYGGVSWKMNQWNPSSLQVKTNESSAASEFRFYNTSAFSGKITKVVITFSALTVSDASKLMFLGGTSEVTATTGGTAGTWDSSTKTLTWTPGASDNFTYFAFYQNGKAASGTNKLATSDAIVVTYETGGTTEKVKTPTFSPAAGTFTEAQNVTISCATDGATIYYTTDGNAPTTSSSVYSSAIAVSSTTTIKAIAVKSGMNNSDVAEATYTINTGGGGTPTPTTGTKYAIVKNTNELKAGDEYIIVYTTSDAEKLAGLGGISDTSTKYGLSQAGPSNLTLSGDTITLPEGSAVTPVILGGESDAWTFKLGNDYLYWSSDNSLTTNSDNSLTNSQWVITIDTRDDPGFTFINKSTANANTKRYLRYNTSNPRFACYKSGQQPIELYRKVVAAKTYDVTVTQSTGGTITASPVGPKAVNAGDKITVTAEADTGYEFGRWDITGAVETAPDANNQITANGNVTISATFSKKKLAISRSISTNGTANDATGGWLGEWAVKSGTEGYVHDDYQAGSGATDYNVVATKDTQVQFHAGTNNGYEILPANISITSGGNPVSFTTEAATTGGGYIVTFTMPAAAVTITANFTTYISDLYILGTANDNAWAGNVGVEMTKPANASGSYSARVYFAGASDDANGYFSFATTLGSNASTYPANDDRINPASDQFDLANNSWTASISSSNASSNSLKIPAGIYDIEVNAAKSQVTVTPVTIAAPTLSIAAGDVYQNSSVSVTAGNLSTLLSTIKSGVSATTQVSTDGTTYSDGSSYTFSTLGNVTVSARDSYGQIHSPVASATYTVQGANNSTTYELVTSASDLVADKKYIIANGNSGSVYVMSKTQNPNNRASVTNTATDNKITISSDEVVLTLGGNATNGWSFFDPTYDVNGGYLYAANTSSGKNNLLRTQSSNDENGLATISFDETNKNAVITFGGSHNDRNTLRFNSTNDQLVFSCYQSTSVQSVYLYKQAEPKAYAITYQSGASGAYGANANEEISVTVVPESGYACTGITVTTTDNNYPTLTANGSGNSYSFTVPALAEGSTITVTPTFAPSISISYVNKYLDINGDEQTGDTGGTVTGPESAVNESVVYVTATPANGYQLKSLEYAWATGHSDVSGTNVGNPYFLMPSTPTTVTAVFERKPYNITVQSANGEVTGVPETAVMGQTVSFTIKAIARYTVTDVSATWQDGEDSGTVTVNYDEGTYSFAMPAHDLTLRIGYFAGDEYELLTDVNDIVEGETYLIVGGSASGEYVPTHVMGTTLESQRLNAVELTNETYDSSTGIISSSSSMNQVNFVAGTDDNAGKWAIHTANGYLYSTTSGNIQCGSTPYYATISVDGNDHNRATIELVSDSYKLSFNSSSPMFRFYSNQQGAAYIYKLANSNKTKKPTITGAAGEYLGLYNFIGTDQVTLGCATAGSSIEYKIGSGEWTAYSEPFALPQTALNGTVTVTARATATGLETSDEVTATFTCIKPEWHNKPCGNNWACNDTTFNNPVFIYPICSIDDRNAYGRANCRFFYTTDGTTPTMASTEVPTPTSGDKFIFVDEFAELTIIPVINGIAGDPVTGIIDFEPAAPVPTLAAGEYDGDQQTRLETATVSKINETKWTTNIWYALETTSVTPEPFAFNATTGEVTSAGWQLYDPSTAPYIDILVTNGDLQYLHSVTLTNFYGGEFTGQYSGASVNLNSTGTWKASAETVTDYQLTAANLDVIFSPAGGTYLYTKHVTLTPQNAIGTVTMTYDITWDAPDATHVNQTGVTYSEAITVDQKATITVHASDSRVGDGGTYEKSHIYNVGVQAPVFSPLPGDYYTGDTGDLTIEMFSVSPNAKIYYTTDGSTPDKTNGTLYEGAIDLPAGTTEGTVVSYKAIAYVGNTASDVHEGTYTIRTKLTGNYWQNIKEMNEDTDHMTAKTLANPVEVIYMSTYQANGTTPEFAFVRDNSGYGYIYFGKNATSKNDWKKYQPGDWIKGKTITGKAVTWTASYINELDMQSQSDNTAWNNGLLENRTLVPEYTTCRAIREGWTGDETFSGTDYESYVDKDKHLFGHYIHLRRNTLSGVSTDNNGKHQGTIIGEYGTKLFYYDGLYLYSGHNGRPNYDQTYFDQIQSKGGTFAVYGIAYFYGPNGGKSSSYYQPYEIFPIDFDYIFPPIFHLVGDGNASDMTQHNIERTIHEPTKLTLTCDTRGAQIWYKTSDMEDYVIYEGEEIAVNKSMTIDTYSTHSTEHFDELVSINRTLTINLGEVKQPVISPVSEMHAIGDPAVSVTITCESENATIWYTTDGSDPKTSETRQEYTSQTLLSVSETTTVRAIAEEDDYFSVEAEQRTYTFVKSNGIVYELVTDVNQLDANSIYVVVNKEYSMSMTRTQKDNNRDNAPVLFVQQGQEGYTAEKQKVYGNEDLAIFTMRQPDGSDNWYFHTANGSDNKSTGFLYGAVSGNTNQLKTEITNSSTTPSGEKLEWTIEIDADGTAHMYNMCDGQPRYLRYNKTFNLFNTYSSENTGQAVYLYKKEATPLAFIEMKGKKNKQYTIADELVGVYAVNGILFAKDQGDVSIAKTEIEDSQEDYMNSKLFNNSRQWDQSNWVAIKFTNEANIESASEYIGKYIKPASVTGTYIDSLNYTIELPATTTELPDNGNAPAYVYNTYGPANFNPANWDITKNGVRYYFLNPKIQEVATITWAVWKDGMFVIPAVNSGGNQTNNQENLDGAFMADWTFQQDLTETLNRSDSPSVYEFTAVIRKKTTSGGNNAPRKAPAGDEVGKAGQTASAMYVVAPLNLTTGSGITTGIDNINGTVEGKEVKAIRVYNVAGVEMREPQPGVNIIVTEYTDGTTTTRKVMK